MELERSHSNEKALGSFVHLDRGTWSMEATHGLLRECISMSAASSIMLAGTQGLALNLPNRPYPELSYHLNLKGTSSDLAVHVPGWICTMASYSPRLMGNTLAFLSTYVCSKQYSRIFLLSPQNLCPRFFSSSAGSSLRCGRDWCLLTHVQLKCLLFRQFLNF